MKKVKLSNSKEFALVDDIDFERVSKHTWRLWGEDKYVAMSKRTGKKVRIVLLHRFIMQPKGGDDVHHVKGNRLDNRREKLECIDHCVHALMFIGPEAKAYKEHVEFHQEPEPKYDYDSIPF